MSTNPVYAWEHPETGTLVRAYCGEPGVRIVRDHVEIARCSAHPNYPVGFAGGRIVFKSAYAHSLVLDLDGPFPQEPRRASSHLRLLIDRHRGLGFSDPRWPIQSPDGAPLVGFVVLDVDTDRILEHWDVVPALRARDPQPVELFPGLPYRTRPRERKPIWETAPELVLAPDGETWAIVGAREVAIGRKHEVTASVAWDSEQLYPQRGRFDLTRGRLYVAGDPGVVAFGLDGAVVASWPGVLPDAPADRQGNRERVVARSTPLPEGEEVLVVVDAAPGATYAKPRWQKVIRLAAADLVYLGDHAMPRFLDSGDSAALVRLADGGLALAPRETPWRILPSPSSPRRTTDDVRVVGDESPSLVAEPAAPWYDPAIGRDGTLASADLPAATESARRSLARFLLHSRMQDPRIRGLLEVDPHAFEPFADALLAFDDGPLLAWVQAERCAVWAAVGASEAAVDALVARIRARALDDATRARVRLLAHAWTHRAFAACGDLGRGDSPVRDLLWNELIEVPADGPAVPRYTLEARNLVAVGASRSLRAPPPAEPGPLSGRSADLWHPQGRGLRCAAPLTEIVTVAAEQLPAGLSSHTFFASSCEGGCDEALTDRYDATVDDGRVTLDGPFDAPPSCPGETSPSEEPLFLGVAPTTVPIAWPAGIAGRLGGRPTWWQHPEVPACPGCGRMMTFAGQVWASSVRDDVADLALYGFQCARCARVAQVVQRT